MYAKENILWYEKEEAIMRRRLELSLVHSLRQEFRDNLAHRTSRIETLATISTLILGFGYNFLTNGVFPPFGDNIPAMVVYSASLAVGMIVPFWALLINYLVRPRVRVRGTF